MECVADGQSGVFAAINRCSHACTNYSPRFTAGTKIVAAGILIAAPCELLLPAALLSRDVRSFFSLNWQIVKTGKVRGTQALEGTSTNTKSSFLHKMVAGTRKISTKRVMLIGAGLLGFAAVGYTTGALSALKVVVLPFVPDTLTFPLTRKLATAIAGISMPQGAAAFEAIRLVVDKMDDLSPSQKSAVLDFLKGCTDSFDGLSSLQKSALGVLVAFPFVLLAWKVCSVAGKMIQSVHRAYETRVKQKQQRLAREQTLARAIASARRDLALRQQVASGAFEEKKRQRQTQYSGKVIQEVTRYQAELLPAYQMDQLDQLDQSAIALIHRTHEERQAQIDQADIAELNKMLQERHKEQDAFEKENRQIGFTSGLVGSLEREAALW